MTDTPTPPEIPTKNKVEKSPTITVDSFTSAIEALLRSPIALLQALPKQPKIIPSLIALLITSTLCFGIVLGSFSGEIQFLAVPLKIAGGIMVAAIICFPSLYVFSCLANTPLRLPGIASAYLCFLSLLALLLVAFTPILWIFTLSSNSLPFVGSLALIVWFLSFLLAGGLLRKLNGGKQAPWQVGLWLTIFFIVTLQISTALRPLLGTATTHFPTEKKFFLAHWSEEINRSLRAARNSSSSTEEEIELAPTQ